MAGDIKSSAFFKEREAFGLLIVDEPPKFDLEAYISNYEGRTRLDRLELIGCTSTFFSVDAFRLAILDARKGKDVGRYEHLTKCLNRVSPEDPLGVADMNWVETTKDNITQERIRLEQELKSYKNNLIKESIRMAHEDLGALYYAIGDLPESLRYYMRMREFCSSNYKHQADMALKLILVGIENRNWLAVQTNVFKSQRLGGPNSEKEKLSPVLSACLGLAHFAFGQFSEATNAFLNTSPAYISSVEPFAGITFQTQVISPNDVAVYAGLSALATMDRNNLQRLVLNNQKFRQFLELEPHIRRAISLFVNSQFSACLSILEASRTDWMCDLYLQSQLERIITLIRRQGIIQYFLPFSGVELEEISRQFGLPSAASGFKESIADELRDMIENEEIDAKLDLVNGLLVSPNRNHEAKIYREVIDMASKYEQELQLRVMRFNMIHAGLEFDHPDRCEDSKWEDCSRIESNST